MALAREGKGKLTLKITDPDGKSGSTVIIGPVRNSYMSVFKTRKNKKRQNQEEYSNVLMIEKTDTEMLKFVRERINHALTKKFGKVIPKFETCLKDGDVEMNDKGEPMYPGFMFIATRADADQPPLLYSPTRVQLDLSSATDWVSGDWGNSKLDFFGYDNENKGVSTRLKAIQFTAKDEPFGKGQQDPDAVRDEFDDAEEVDAAAAGGNFLD
jgi:hypothetical protein